MLRAPVLAANWKMHHAPAAAGAFIESLLASYSPRKNRIVVFFPPAVSIHALAAAVSGRSDVMVGVQNIHWAEKGAFTGETSAEMARDAGAQLVLVGHSERRHVFGETDANCARKCVAAVRAGLPFMLCVGETIDQRETGDTSKVVSRQLREGLGKLENLISTDFAIAYEPVWAIGTGMTASTGDASAIHTLLRAELTSMIGTRADDIPILYGGSVNTGNAATLLAAPEIDGLLVGGASLDVTSWLKIIEA